MPMITPWPPAYIDAMRAHAAAGLSCSQSAQKLFEEFGAVYSRNAIIGKARRAGIVFGGGKGGLRPGAMAKAVAAARRPRGPRVVQLDRLRPNAPDPGPDAPPRKPFSARPSRARLAPLPAFAAAPLPKSATWQPLPGTRPVGLLDLRENHCRWPVGQRIFCVDGSQHALEVYCGCAKFAGRPYCADHARIARGAANGKFRPGRFGQDGQDGQGLEAREPSANANSRILALEAAE